MLDLIVAGSGIASWAVVTRIDKRLLNKWKPVDIDPNCWELCLMFEVRHTQQNLVDEGVLEIADMAVCDNEDCEGCKDTRTAVVELARAEYYRELEAAEKEAKQKQLLADARVHALEMKREQGEAERRKLDALLAKDEAIRSAEQRRRDAVEADEVIRNGCGCYSTFKRGELIQTHQCQRCNMKKANSPVERTANVCASCAAASPLFVATVGTERQRLCAPCYWYFKERHRGKVHSKDFMGFSMDENEPGW